MGPAAPFSLVSFPKRESVLRGTCPGPSGSSSCGGTSRATLRTADDSGKRVGGGYSPRLYIPDQPSNPPQGGERPVLVTRTERDGDSLRHRLFAVHDQGSVRRVRSGARRACSRGSDRRTGLGSTGGAGSAFLGLSRNMGGRAWIPAPCAADHHWLDHCGVCGAVGRARADLQGDHGSCEYGFR